MTGCWAAYAYDYGPYLISVHETEVEALRATTGHSGYAVFMQWGDDLQSAISRDEAETVRSRRAESSR